MATRAAAADELDTDLLLHTLAAFRAGDFSVRLPANWTGVSGKIADSLNEVIARNELLSQELQRLRRVVGKEGRITHRISTGGFEGEWASSVHSVNDLVEDLVRPTSETARVITAVANGDLTQTVPLEVEGVALQGQFARTAQTVNTMVSQLSSFTSEVTRVAREVGTEGKLGGQARVKGVGGVWKELTDSVNTMAGNLTAQVRNIADVTTAVARGDLSKKITVEGRGEILELKDTINVMVDQLNGFASEVTRVAREVGTDGKLGGQAHVRGVGGVWKELTDNVNLMGANLTAQVRNIAEVTTAVANGDLSKQVTVDVQGEILELKNTINVMVDQLNGFASEVTRVAREVGTEGKLGGQAHVRGVSGTWADLTDNVNLMGANLTAQVRNIAEVTTAVANGDLSKKITVEGRGEILELKNTINVMVDQLNGFASEVTRVAREVGTEGKLGVQADVRGVSGTWKDLTDSVNTMAVNLTDQVRNIADVTTAVARGDLSRKITVEGRGEILELKDTINVMVDQLNGFASEVTRLAREVGTEGRLGGQADVRDVSGTWKDLTDGVNTMAANLTGQVRNIADVTTAVARGDLSKKITVEGRGEILELKDTINVMVDQLNGFASEVTRVAREVGTDGKLGGQAHVRGVDGVWKELTDNVNLLAGQLTSQIRNIAEVTTAVARGDLSRKVTVDVQGEILELKNTINVMVDQLNGFASEVTRVAREVGTEGKLGGQAHVPGVSGTWKDLTDNVNQLAATLTDQIRAISDVATAVTEGDLTRSIGVQASGEVAVLKDNLNEMIRNLRETTQRNTEQDWLKTNLARFTRMLQGQRDLATSSRLILSELAPLVNAQQAVFYTMDDLDQAQPVLRYQAGYAYRPRAGLSELFRIGEGLVGQCAQERKRILVRNVPENYLTISSGLGEAAPVSIVVLPVVFEGQVLAVLELASFEPFGPTHLDLLDQLTESIGIVLNTIAATMQTEQLLEQSQSMADELRAQQEELRQTNEELEEKARLLAERNTEVERKNDEVEQARHSLEEKAEQLALTSKYKSEFLANMSHELRTPLNSLLILAQQLAENADGNLSSKQVEFAQIILASGQDLLNLINDILDLSKIESGTVALEIGEETFGVIREQVERGFRHVADARGLEFQVELDPNLPRSLRTDLKRMHQVLRNLLSNAFKFTERGRVDLRVRGAESGWGRDVTALERAREVIAFEVSDTGVGIPPENQLTIFEAFQQSDGTTSRKYGGTGLGLSISRELVRLLGGQITLRSAVGVGSTFTVFLPVEHVSETGGGVAGIQPAVVRTSPLLPVDDDRDRLRPGDSVVLIVDDDVNFCRVLLDLAHEAGFKGIVALSGEEALALAREYRPTAVTLDIGLRDISGWKVLEALHRDPQTNMIPVHIVTVFEDAPNHVEGRGALTFLTKPATKDQLQELFTHIEGVVRTGARNVLVVEDDPVQRAEIVRSIARGQVAVRQAATVQDALDVIEREPVDCVVLDLRLPDSSGFDLIERFRESGRLRRLPVVVYTAAELSPTESRALQLARYGLVMKGKEHAAEHLLEEVSRFLAGVGRETAKGETANGVASGVEVPEIVDSKPDAAPPAVRAEPDADRGSLANKTILVVDDDVRNVFALTAMLERHGLRVVPAESGHEALAILDRTPEEVDAVLLDIMMPDVDGYETLRRIRRHPARASLPIIALTAKAMKGDRERCLEAGASDYISKPVDSVALLRMLQAWLNAS